LEKNEEHLGERGKETDFESAGYLLERKEEGRQPDLRRGQDKEGLLRVKGAREINLSTESRVCKEQTPNDLAWRRALGRIKENMVGEYRSRELQKESIEKRGKGNQPWSVNSQKRDGKGG